MVQPVAGGCCNLLAALRCSLMMGGGVDVVGVVLCGSPDQDHNIIVDHVTQRLAGCTCPMLHLVAFDCEQNEVLLMKRLSDEISHSSFHHYQVTGSYYQGCDLFSTFVVG